MPDVADQIMPPLTIAQRPWAIRRDALPRLAAARARVDAVDLGRFAEDIAATAPKAARRGSGQRAGGAVAVIPLTGVITPRGSWLSMLFGGGPGGLLGFRADFRDALADPDVGAIVLDVDSPGGLIDLVPEAAAEIRAARGEKPIIAVANTMAASAAYWIAAQADELVVTPSGDVGSVGVYVLHEDWSGWNEQAGIDPTYVFAGRYKVEGNMDEPLSDEAKAAIQADVDHLYGMFVDAVAAGRGVSAETVRANYGEGRTLLADQALAAGMVDRVATLEDVVRELLATSGGGPAPRAAAPAPAVPAAAETDVDDETRADRAADLPELLLD